MLRKPRARGDERALGAREIAPLEARRQKASDLSERGTSVARNVAEKRPHRAQDFAHLREILIACGREKDGNPPDEWADHMAEPVLDRRSESIELLGRVSRRQQLGEKPRDLGADGVIVARRRDAAKGKKSGLESLSAIHSRGILLICSVDQVLKASSDVRLAMFVE